MRTISNRRMKMIVCAVALLASTTATQAEPTDNAALLYYQAFLLHETPDETTVRMLDDFRRGKTAANDIIAEHIEKNRRVIDLVVTAADAAKCDWGYDYSQGAELTMPNLAQLRRIAFLLSTEARWLASRGNCQTALDRCVTLRRMAVHTCDRTIISYLMGMAIDGLANGATEDVLALVPEDVDALCRFKSRLTQTEERFPSLAHCLTEEAQVCTATMWKDKAQPLASMLEESLEGDFLKSMVERVRKGDDEFFKRNRDYYLNAIAMIAGTLDSDLSYAQMCAKLGAMPKQWSQEARNNPDATLTALSLPDVTKLYQVTVRRQTHLNAIATAIDLYVAKARTRQLPDTLPADSAPDLFSGKPFVYEKADDHFILRCQTKENPEKAEAYQYEFRIKQ